MLRTKRSAWAFKLGERGGETNALDAGREKHTAEQFGVETQASMNEVTATVEKAIKAVGEIACRLLHPSGMRFRDDSGDVHVACGQTNDEEDVVTDQANCGPDLRREEVTRCVRAGTLSKWSGVRAGALDQPPPAEAHLPQVPRATS